MSEQQTTALSPIEAVRGTLTKMSHEFQSALPPQIPVEKFIRTTLTAIQMQPALLDTDRRSLLGSCMKAAQDGLLCDGREAALVIFKGHAQYLPMVGGILKKMRNSGEIASIGAHVVYENDHFDYSLGDDEQITHKPLLTGDRGKAIAAYAIAKTKDGAIYREVMSLAEIEKVRNASRASGNGPWVQWWDEMARTTVIKRIAKRLPSSADVDQVIDASNEIVGFSQQSPIDITPAKPSIDNPTQPSRLKQAIIDADGVVESEGGEA